MTSLGRLAFYTFFFSYYLVYYLAGFWVLLLSLSSVSVPRFGRKKNM